MKDIKSTLTRIDEEITGHEQMIARSQVEIHRLQTTRRTLMAIAESDIQHAEAMRQDDRKVIAGEHAKPVLIVRKAGSGELEERAVKAKANGHAKPEKRHARGGNRKPGAPSISGAFKERICKMLSEPGTEPMTSLEIGDYLGLPRAEKNRKDMSNALYSLRVKGVLLRNDDFGYSINPKWRGEVPGVVQP